MVLESGEKSQQILLLEKVFSTLIAKKPFPEDHGGNLDIFESGSESWADIPSCSVNADFCPKACKLFDALRGRDDELKLTAGE